MGMGEGAARAGPAPLGDSASDHALWAAAVGGAAAVPLPEPVQALAVTDRLLPAQDPAAPGAAELAACIAEGSTDSPADRSRWLLIGRHEVGDAVPGGPIARIDDVVSSTSLAGICVSEVDGSDRAFISGVLPPPDDEVQVFQYQPGRRAAVLLATAPEGVTRLRISLPASPATGPDCTIIDELAVCTLELEDRFDPRVVLTAYTAAAPGGREVYRN